MKNKIIQFSIEDLQNYFKVKDFDELVSGPIAHLIGCIIIADHPSENLTAQPIVSIEIMKESANTSQEIILHYINHAEQKRDRRVLRRNSTMSNWTRLIVPNE